MHYFKRNIGDYHKKAGRLSMLEHGAYTLLMDACYDRERFPTRDEAIEWCWARSQAETEAVDFVLSRFFELVDGVYRQDRIADELEDYRGKSEKNAQIARDREAKRKANKQPTVDETLSTEHETLEKQHEAPPNHKPLTTNHKPQTIIDTAGAVSDNVPVVLPLAPLKKPKADKGHRLPDDWILPKAAGEWAMAEGLSRDQVLREAERFKDYWHSKPGREALKTDWAATWRNWIRKAVDSMPAHRKQQGGASMFAREHGDTSWADGLTFIQKHTDPTWRAGL